MLELTDEQRAAVESDLPAIVVQAAAGSGKTTVIAARIAAMVRSGIYPESILALTFTRSACASIHTRVANEIGPLADRVRIMTFHGYAWSIHPERDRLSVASEDDVRAAIRSVVSGPTSRPGSPGIRTIERAIIDHESGVSNVTPEVVDVVRQRLRAARLIPTWDLVPDFGHDDPCDVLVDEAQDVTPNELLMVERLSNSHRVFIVQDPRQSIMQWRGGIGTNANPTHALTKSFRFGPEIAEYANRIAARFNYSGIEGIGPAGQVVEAPIEMILDAYGSRAVLCRTHHECAMIAKDLGESAEHVTRDMRDSEADRFAEISNKGKIAVCTVWAAKGREWDSVAVAPSWRNEDPRVDYVAATRARTTLIIAD
jgi:superfamily I DNA/RNA helicase